jgi:hypothetical protein
MMQLLMGKTHGTNCAGEVAMEKNNGVCGMGLAVSLVY